MKKKIVIVGLLIISLVFSSCVPRPKQSSESTEPEVHSEEDTPEEIVGSEKNTADMQSGLSEAESAETSKEATEQDKADPAEASIETSSRQRDDNRDGSSNTTENTIFEGIPNGGGIELPDDPIEE